LNPEAQAKDDTFASASGFNVRETSPQRKRLRVETSLAWRAG
jgi:hypothetical protein